MRLASGRERSRGLAAGMQRTALAAIQAHRATGKTAIGLVSAIARNWFSRGFDDPGRIERRAVASISPTRSDPVMDGPDLDLDGFAIAFHSVAITPDRVSFVVVLTVRARRFRCTDPDCPRAIFCERLHRLASPRPTAAPPSGWRGSTSPSAWPWGARPGPGSPGSWAWRSAPKPCSAELGASTTRSRPLPFGTSGSTTGPGARAGPTARSSSTWNAAGSSTCCPTARRRPSDAGWPTTPASSWSAATEPRPTLRRHPRRPRRPARSPIAGTC